MRSWIDKCIATFIMTLLGMMLLCVIWQVAARYLTPVFPSLMAAMSQWTPMTEEIARFGLIWLGILGAGYVTGLKKHLAIDLLTNALPSRFGKPLGVFVEILIITFAVIVMIYGGFDLMSKTFAKGQVSPVMHLPIGWVYMSVPLSGLMVAGYSLLNLRDRIKAGSSTTHVDA